MKIKFILLFILCLALLLVLYKPTPRQEAEWYPFVLAERLDPDSPANMGKLVLDPPAGKHGFCKAKDGHFYFEDGTRAKFWGTNLCFNACFPTKEQAELLADRIAFFGFNAVRLTHMDTHFEPRGIFKDVCPDTQNPQVKKTNTLSKEQLNRLDYLIYQLKKRGIYVDINLLVRRRFTLADGVVDADKFTGGAKPVSMFSPKIIELQKDYAKALLTHYNPYTKMRYCDEPAIALVEITNENSIHKYNIDKLPEYYRKEFYELTKSLPKEERIDLLEKKYFDEMTDFLKNKIGVKIPITGSQYPRAEAQKSCDFVDKHAYWDHPRFPHKAWDINDFTIHNKSTLLDKNLGIINSLVIASREATKQSKPYTITEWNHCYPNQYAYETPVLIAAYASQNDWDGLFQFAFSHGWESKPKFDRINNYFDAIANTQKLISCSLGSFLLQKAEKLDFKVEDGILKINSPNIQGACGFIKDKIISLGNISFKAGDNGAVFLYSSEGKNIQDSNNLILLLIGEIKNKDSGWNNERFNWGTSPVMLKKIDAEIEIKTAKNIWVYELNQDDKRSKRIKSSLKHGALLFSTNKSNSPWLEISSR